VSDAYVRRLQRQLANTPDVVVAGKVLLETVRAGRLSPAALELLAAAGQPAARAALGEPVLDERPLREWVWALRPWGRPLVVRALVAAARHVLPVTPTGSRPLLDAAESWCACPCTEHAEAAYRASRIAEPDAGGAALAYHAVMSAHVAGHMHGEAGDRSLFSMVGILLRAARQAGGETASLRAAMRQEVVAHAWAKTVRKAD
jgi:hypothetical protein